LWVWVIVYFRRAAHQDTPHFANRHTATMAHVDEQENIADGLVASASFKASSLSPKKAAPKKKRAKSIGPGGLEKEEEAPLKASSGNRRKVRVQYGEWVELLLT
jgi:hypothetical protein